MPTELLTGSKKAQKVRQACDCCHARKIRCDGEKPCKNCQVTELQCTYLAVPKKKGPKGRRIVKETKPIPIQRPRIFDQDPPSESHPIQHQTAETRDFPLVNILDQLPLPLDHPKFSDSVINPLENGPNGGLEVDPDPTSRLVSDELVKTCLNAFFTHKYPIMPVLDKEATYATIPHLHNNPEQYGLITALCALIVLQPEIIDTPQPGTTWPSSQSLINETLQSRQSCDYIENPSLAGVHTSFFLFAALFALGKDNSAWFYIRESMTMLQILRLHEEGPYKNLDDQYSMYCRRTFWLLFITERGYALQRQHRPVTLQRTIDLPTVELGPEAIILSGFIDLVTLFQNFDDSFFSSSTDSTSSPQSLVQLQDILKAAVPNASERTEIQQADLLVSRQWLKTMVWQLCVNKGFLSSRSADESMSFHYPVSIARDMVRVSRTLPATAFEANGVGILEKVFDIGCSLSDVLLLHPNFINSSGMEIGPRDYLMELVRVLGANPGGDKYLRLLMAKANESLQVRLRESISNFDASDRIEEIDEDEDYLMNEDRSVAIHDQLNLEDPPTNDGWIVADSIEMHGQERAGYSMHTQNGDQALRFSPPTAQFDMNWTSNSTAMYENFT